MEKTVMKRWRRVLLIGGMLLASGRTVWAGSGDAQPKGALYREYLSFLGNLQTTVRPSLSAAAQSLERLDQRANRERIRNVVHKSLSVRHDARRGIVWEEATELLEELSLEIDRLAAEMPDTRKFRENTSQLLAQVQDWAVTPPAVRIAAVQRPVSSPTRAAADSATGFALQPTEDNIEGPFYRPNAPFTNRLRGSSPGDALVMSGKVLNTEGIPIANALVDVWQADSQGDYDISDPVDRNNPAIPHRLRGRMRADVQGEFRFETIVPGAYAIGGGRFRPKHIHWKVSAPGFRSLTTQMYFEGDIYNAVDPWWKPSLTVPLKVVNGQGTATFDIVLPRQP